MPPLRLTGASVDIRSSAVDILKWMGVEPQIRKHATNEEGIAFVGANGCPIATFRATGRSDIQSFTPEYEIFRSALAKIFIEPIAERVKLVFNESVDQYEQGDERVLVTFASQRKEKHDLLVAADGLRPKLRGSMLNKSPHEQIHDKGVHAAYFTIKKDLLQSSRLAKWHNMTGGRCVFLRPDPDPAGHTRANLLNVTWSSDTKMKGRLNQALKKGNESYLLLMEELYRDADWLTAEVRSPKLHDGRVVLVGDAGYATPSLGTSLAIVGGYVLAGELLSHPGDIRTALTQYGKLLGTFVRASQHDDIVMQLLNPQKQPGISLRNAILWLTTTIKLPQQAILVAVNSGSLKDLLHSLSTRGRLHR